MKNIVLFISLLITVVCNSQITNMPGTTPKVVRVNTTTSIDSDDSIILRKSGGYVTTISKTDFVSTIGISASPAGANTQVQFNNSGAFGADADFTWSTSLNALLLSGSTNNAGLYIDKAGTSGAYPFMQFGYGGVTVLTFENAAGSGFAPAMKMTPDGVTWNHSQVISITQDAGTLPALIVDGRKSASALTSQPLFGVYNYGTDKFTIKYNGVVNLPGYAGSGNRVSYLDGSEDFQVSAIDPANIILQGSNTLTGDFTLNGNSNTYGVNLTNITGLTITGNNGHAITGTTIALTASSGAIALNGGQIVKRTPISTNSTVTINDYYIEVDATAGNVTVTFPLTATLAGNPYVYVIKRIDSSGNTVTVAGNTSQTVEGAASVTLTARQSKTFIWNATATDWEVN